MTTRRTARRYQCALVTGASSGLGRAIAAALLDAGLTVYATARQPNSGRGDSRLHWLALDGSDSGQVASFISAQSQLLSKVDILVNNMGAGWFGPVEQWEEEELSASLRLLLESPVQLTAAVMPGMRERGRGVVVNVSSLAAEMPLPLQATYSAAKAGLSGFTRSLMLREGRGGIDFIDFQPGDLRTDFNRNGKTRGEDAGQAAVWQRMEALLAKAPPPEQAARKLMRAIERGGSRVVRAGGFFQSQVAPLAMRLLPVWAQLAVIRRYYGLK